MFINMESLYRIALLLIVTSFLTVAVFSSDSAYADESAVLTGNIICLFPDKNTGKVTAEIYSAPCIDEPEHIHFFMDTGNRNGYVYAVEGSQEVLDRLKKSSDRKNIQLIGKISGNQKAWIITVE